MTLSLLRRIFLGSTLVALPLAAGMLATGAPPATDICPVHGIKMEKKVLRLVYGMPSPREFEEMRVAKTAFPFGRDYLLAGCVLKPEKTKDGFLCPECVKAREAWLAANKPKPAE